MQAETFIHSIWILKLNHNQSILTQPTIQFLGSNDEMGNTFPKVQLMKKCKEIIQNEKNNQTLLLGVFEIIVARLLCIEVDK